MSEPFAEMLKGGHRNSLGRTDEAIAFVLADRGRLDELFACLADPDELVRMRAGDALEKVCRARPAWLRPYVGRLLGDVGAIAQPSVQWHVAQMLQHLRGDLTAEQSRRAVALLQRNLASASDWIVLNVTIDVLSDWAQSDPGLREWLRPELERLSRDPRKSVSKRASKRLASLMD
jgi:HEAT repeat protein